MSDMHTQSVAMPTDIPTSETIGGGIYTVLIEEAAPEVSDRDGILQIKMVYRITDPDLANAPIYERIRLGSETDPMARDPRTWKAGRSGGRTLARLLDAAGCQNVGDLGANCQGLIGKRLLARVTETEGKNANVGRFFNNVRAYFRLGERELMRDADVEAGLAAGTPMGGGAGSVGPAPLAPTAVPNVGPASGRGAFE